MRTKLSSATMTSLIALAFDLNEQPEEIRHTTTMLTERIHGLLNADHTVNFVATGNATDLGTLYKELGVRAPECHKLKWSNDRCVLRSLLISSHEKDDVMGRRGPLQIEIIGGGLIISIGRIFSASQIVCLLSTRHHQAQPFKFPDLKIAHFALGYALDSARPAASNRFEPSE